MEDKKDEHKCNICNKIFSSYKTLWTHNKNIHKNNNTISKLIVSNKYDNSQLKINKIYKCKYCNNEYNHKQSRWTHEKKCKIIFDENEQKEQKKQNTKIKLAEINKEIELAKINKEIKLAEINKEIELKKIEVKKENSLIKKEQKLHETTTIKKINKMLRQKINMKNSNNNNTINNIQNNNIVHNHFKIEPFGKENILNTITDKEKKLIINQGFGSIEKLIEITNAGKYDQFKNIIITNKRENTAHIFDDKSGTFISCDKNWALSKLVSNRLDDIEEIYNELDENNKLNNSTKKILSNFFIKFMDENKIYIDENANNKEHKNYSDFKVDNVNNLLFNYQDKIINDIGNAINNAINNQDINNAINNQDINNAINNQDINNAINNQDINNQNINNQDINNQNINIIL